VSNNDLTVYPYASRVIDGAEMQYNPLAVRRYLEFALVPARMMKARIADPAGGGLRRKRNLDRKRPRSDVGRLPIPAIVVERKFPAAVERRPLSALELGAGIAELQIDTPSHTSTRDPAIARPTRRRSVRLLDGFLKSCNPGTLSSDRTVRPELRADSPE
jgi:hypothetical protein